MLPAKIKIILPAGAAGLVLPRPPVDHHRLEELEARAPEAREPAPAPPGPAGGGPRARRGAR